MWSRGLGRRLELWIQCLLGTLPASSLPATPILTTSSPTDVRGGSLRQSTLKARHCVAVQSSHSSIIFPFQQSPVTSWSKNFCFVAAFRSLIQLRIHRCSQELRPLGTWGAADSSRSMNTPMPWGAERGCKLKAVWRRDKLLSDFSCQWASSL